MKNNLRLLNFFSKKFDLTVFYTISVSDYGITLQGKYNPTVMAYLTKNKAQMHMPDNGFIVFNLRNIEITFTN